MFTICCFSFFSSDLIFIKTNKIFFLICCFIYIGSDLILTIITQKKIPANIKKVNKILDLKNSSWKQNVNFIKRYYKKCQILIFCNMKVLSYMSFYGNLFTWFCWSMALKVSHSYSLINENIDGIFFLNNKKS